MNKKLLLTITLITAGINIHTMDIDIFAAVKSKNIAAVQAYIDAGGNVNIRDPWRATLLHHAAKNDDLVMAKLLVASGADIEAKHGTSATPLITAAAHKSRIVARFLMEQGANKEAQDEYRKTPFMYDPELRRVWQGILLHRALAENNIQGLMDLLKQGAPINATNEKGQTLLHIAVLQYRPNLIKHLLARGANLTIKDNNGETPVDIAANSSQELLLIFLEAGYAQKVK